MSFRHTKPPKMKQAKIWQGPKTAAGASTNNAQSKISGDFQHKKESQIQAASLSLASLGLLPFGVSRSERLSPEALMYRSPGIEVSYQNDGNWKSEEPLASGCSFCHDNLGCICYLCLRPGLLS